MLHTIRKLAREIHRRSLWQVVGGYVLVSWAAFTSASVATDVVGLPSWTPTVTMVLILMFLPVVVATAVVQEGLPGLRIVDVADPNELPGFTPDEVLVIPEAHPLHGVGLLTWRNTILGAVSSAALLLTSVVAYLVMWALGIGPVGSLLAQGVIQERDALVVAAFENRTDDPSLGAVVTDAFEIDLFESTVVTVVAGAELREARDRVGVATGTPLTTARARELAFLEGIPVIVEGDITRSARGYTVAAAIVIPAASTTFRFDERATGDEDLLLAVDRLAERIREKLGESLRSVRRGERVVLATESAEALRQYGLAGRAWDRGAGDESVELLAQAVEIDPDFAMAWRRLGVTYEQMGDTARALEAYARAVELWSDIGDSSGRTVRALQVRIAALD